MKQFNTCYAAISFFDGQYENFKAENGYQRRQIPRGVSIAAHALMSTDVFVVLDTAKVGMALAQSHSVLTHIGLAIFGKSTCHGQAKNKVLCWCANAGSWR